MANPFYVEPANVLPGLGAAFEGMRQGAGAQQERESTDFQKAKQEQFTAMFQEASPEEIASYVIKNPDMADSIKTAQDIQRTMTDEENTQSAWDVITGKISPKDALFNRAETIHERGGDASHTIALAQNTLQGGDMAIKGAYAYLAAHDPKGLESYMKATGGGEETDQTTDIKNWKKFVDLKEKDPEAAAQFGKQVGFIEKNADVTPTDIDDYVSDAELCATGDTAACARNENRMKFKRAQPEEVSAVQQAKDAAKTASDMADKLQNVKSYLGNLKEIKRLVDSGARTGAVEGRLPSFRSASVELDNIRNQLGLNVIQSATFGPLSEKELKFALSTALPTGLDGAELKAWVDRKIESQEKLYSFIEDAVAFLSVPGNTKAGWVEYQKKRGKKAGGSTGLPEGITEEDIQTTMQNHGMTRQQVLDKLGAQ